MSWYNLVAPLYDVSGTARVYQPMRRETVRHLRLEPGHCVLDLACGTGLNFPLVLEAIGPTGTLIGTDYSAGMLAEARRRVARQAAGERVRLVQADARALSRELLRAALPFEAAPIDRVICTLGLSVVPDWELVFARTFGLLAPGGRCALMDGYFDRLTLRARLVNTFAAANVTRRFWEPLRQGSEDYEERAFPFFGGRILVVSGTKPRQ